MAKIKHIEKQWNTYHAVVYIPKPIQQFFPHEDDGPNSKKGKFKTRLSASLKTDSLALAQKRALPVISHFKALILAEKEQIEPSAFDFDKAVKNYSESFKALRRNEDALTHIARLAKASIVEKGSDEETIEVNEKQMTAYNVATGKGLATDLYLNDWLDQCGYNPKGRDEAGRFIKQDFCKSFPVF